MIRLFAHLSWATLEIRSRSLFWHEWPERFAHSPSFVLSNLRESLTVAHLILAIWANEQMSKWAMSEWAMSKWANFQPWMSPQPQNPDAKNPTLATPESVVDTLGYINPDHTMLSHFPTLLSLSLLLPTIVYSHLADENTSHTHKLIIYIDQQSALLLTKLTNLSSGSRFVRIKFNLQIKIRITWIWSYREARTVGW